MVTLTAGQIADAINKFVSLAYNNPSNPITPNKTAHLNTADVNAAVNTIITWLTANEPALVTALQTNAANFYNNSTAAEKRALFYFVVLKLSGFG